MSGAAPPACSIAISQTPLAEVVDAMAARKLDAVVVFDPGGACGIFTTVDLCTALSITLRPAA